VFFLGNLIGETSRREHERKQRLSEERRKEGEGKERELVSLIATTKKYRAGRTAHLPPHEKCSLFTRTTYTFMIYSRLFVICTHAYT